MTKIDSIQNFINTYGSITKFEGAMLFKEYGLKGKINRLIDRGMVINTVMIERPDRQAYARYTKVK